MKWLIRHLTVKGIQKKMMAAIILFLVLPLIFISYTYTRTIEEMIQDRIEEENSQMLAQISRSVDQKMQQMVNATNYFALSKSVRSVLFEGDIDYSADYKVAEKKYYNNYMVVNDSMSIVQNTILPGNNFHITLFDLQGNNYTSQPKRTANKDDHWREEDWFEKTIELKGYMLWTFHYDAETNRYLVTLSRLVNESVEGKWQGVITITSDAEALFGSILGSYGSDLVMLVNHEERVIASSQSGDMSGSTPSFALSEDLNVNHIIINDGSEKFFVSQRMMDKADWRLVSVSDYDTLFQQLIDLRTRNLLMIGGVLVLFIFISYIIISRIIQPIFQLIRSMEAVEQGDFESSIEVNGDDEIALLGRSFNRMILEINRLITGIHEEQEKEKALQLQILYAQINPHFLFNTLNAIKWIAIINKSKNVAKLIGDLGRLLEMSIKDIDQPIPFSEELANLMSYVNLQQARYNKKQSILYQIDKDCNSCMVPKLILQPIVENALIHGMDGSRSENMTVTVQAHLTSEANLEIKVIDDGKGIPAERLALIHEEGIRDVSGDRFSGIGLSNVHQRIKMRYGAIYGIGIESRENEGTQVTILLPGKEPTNDSSDDC